MTTILLSTNFNKSDDHPRWWHAIHHVIIIRTPADWANTHSQTFIINSILRDASQTLKTGMKIETENENQDL